MYCTNFICTYKLHNENNNEDMYRIQLLQAFESEKWNDNIINNKIKNLYEKIKNNDDIKNIILKIKDSENFKLFANLFENDELVLFNLLFSYDFFDLTHLCICDIFNNKNIKNENKNNLINNL